MNIAVLGAGISGLSFAYRFQKLAQNHPESHTLTLFESSDRAGGTIQTLQKNGFTLELGPDSFLSEKPWALELSRELGLESEIIGTNDENRKMFVSRGTKLLQVPQGFYLIAPSDIKAFLLSSLFSPLEKFRMLYETNIPKKENEEDESVASFITRRFGKAALQKIGQAMVAGIYTGDPEILSAKSVLPRFVEYEKKFGSVLKAMTTRIQASGPRYSLFLSYKKGMQTLTDALLKCLTANQIQYRSSATQVFYDSERRKWRIDFQNKESQFFDAVVLTLNAQKASLLVQKMNPALSGELSKIPTESVATINLAYPKNVVPHAMHGFGFVVPKIENRSIIACTFVHQKYKFRAPETHALLRVFVGGAFGRQVFEQDDDEILKNVKLELKELLGIQEEPEFVSFQRYPKAMVQYCVGHQERVERIQKMVKNESNFYLIGSSYNGVGIPDCIREAESAAEEILK